MFPGKKFFWNGDEYWIDDDVTLLDVIQYFDYHLSLFVVEYNQKICHKKRWKTIQLKNNDRIEVITIVGGG